MDTHLETPQSEPSRRLRALGWCIWFLPVSVIAAFVGTWSGQAEWISAPNLVHEILGRKLAYCFPIAQFPVGVGPYPNPLNLAALFYLGLFALPGLLVMLKVPSIVVGPLSCVAFCVGYGLFEPSRLSHAHFQMSSTHYLLKNIAWSVGAAVFVLGLWGWLARPGWRRVIAACLPAIALSHLFASVVYVFNIFVSVE